MYIGQIFYIILFHVLASVSSFKWGQKAAIFISRYEPQREWRMVVALAEDMAILIYGSKNLKQWRYLSIFTANVTLGRGTWECPNLLRCTFAC